MTSNASIVLRKKANKQGLYPLAIRVSKNRRSNYIYIGHYIELNQWDSKKRIVRKSHPHHDRLNHLLASKLVEVNKTVLELQTENQHISSTQIKKEITSTSEFTTFYEVAGNYLNELESRKKLSRLFADRVRINHVLNYYGSQQLRFQEIDESFLRRFQSYLKSEHNLSERSIVNNLVVIRTLFNRAIKLRIVDQKLYPFGADKIRIRFPETEKLGLSTDEIQKIEGLTNLSSLEEHARNVWLFSFYLAGIRVGDVLKIRWSDIYDNRLHYRMNKNSKLVSLKLPQKALPILEQYQAFKGNSDDFVFPDLKMADPQNERDVYAKTNTAVKKFNKSLKAIGDKAGIKKKLSMHIARHSFGNIAGDKIPIQMLQKLYRHSSITTTITYQANFMHRDADEALDKVIDF